MQITQRVSVVIPAYNEADSIGGVLTALSALDAVDEIIVVDDGSSDATSEVAAAHTGVRVLRHPYNIGNGAAVKTGIRAARGDIVLVMDGDGQHPPAEVPHLLRYMDTYDMVVGARSTGTQAVWSRRVANAVFNRYASYITNHPVPDLTSGFRAMRTSVARSFLYLLPNGFSSPTTLTIAFFRAGYAVKYHPFASPARGAGSGSKIRPLRDGFRFLLTLTRLATVFVPLKIFLPISVAFLGVGGTYTLLALLLQQRFSGFGGLITSIGVFTFLLGLVSEQIALLRYINSDR